MINVLVWNEFYHEQFDETPKSIYPDGMHKTIADFLKCDDISVKTATMYDENCGITKELLDETDVLIWWAHTCHDNVPDNVAMMVRDAVHKGMGAIFLHAAHRSKPFMYLMGTSGCLSWREDEDMERLWVIDPSHPIAQGLDRYIEIPHEEVYSEPFDIPTPDRLIFTAWYEGGEVFRSGCCYKRGRGNVFYFQPGHETYPIYHDKNIQHIIKNAVRWAAPTAPKTETLSCPHIKKIER